MRGVLPDPLKTLGDFLVIERGLDFIQAGLSRCSIYHQVREEELVDGETDIPVEEDMTGQIGTAMYVAPELSVSRVTTYNQKVDLYR